MAPSPDNVSNASWDTIPDTAQHVPDECMAPECIKFPPEGVRYQLCSKCKSVRYCSRECQKAAWKAHKKACNEGYVDTDYLPECDPRSTAGDCASAGTKYVFNAFWNDAANENEAFTRIIDCYRLRVEDEYVYLGGNTRGIYNEDDPLDDFRAFLDKAEQKGVLPSWWNKDKRKKCERLGMRTSKNHWARLDCAVEKSDILEHYGDPMMPISLRMLAETIEGFSAEDPF